MANIDRDSAAEKDAFAQMLIGKLRAAGETEEIHYDSKEFMLFIGAGMERRVFLGNLFRDHNLAKPENKPKIVRNFVRSCFAVYRTVPTDFEDIKPDLLVSVRPRSYIENHQLQFRFSDRFPEWPYLICGQHFSISLVYHMRESLMQIYQLHLERWNVTFQEAVKTAYRNLLEISARPFVQVAAGVWRSPWGDNLDTSRLLLPQLLQRHEVQGDIVAMAPHRDMLIFTGSDNPAGLRMMAKIVEDEVNKGQTLAGETLRLVDNQWTSYLPAPNHIAYIPLANLLRRSMNNDYKDQRDRLIKMFDGNPDFPDVAPMAILQDKTTKELTTFAAWMDRVPLLLPKSDLIIFFKTGEDEHTCKILGSARWDRVLEHLGDKMKPRGWYPELWEVREFPTEELINQIHDDSLPMPGM
jgi:hypothetical protein